MPASFPPAPPAEADPEFAATGATDVEVESVRATLAAADASEIANRIAAVAAKQDAATAATDAELVAVRTALAARYHTIHEARGNLQGGAVSGTSFALYDEYGNVGPAAASGIAVLPFDFVPADYALAGHTTKLNLVTGVRINNTAPLSTLTFGLYPVTNVTGGNISTSALTLGPVVTGSNVSLVAPAANSIQRPNSGDFDAPGTGSYVVIVAVSVANVAANSQVAMHVQVRYRNIPS